MTPVHLSTPEIRVTCPDDQKFAIVERAVAAHPVLPCPRFSATGGSNVR